MFQGNERFQRALNVRSRLAAVFCTAIEELAKTHVDRGGELDSNWWRHLRGDLDDAIDAHTGGLAGVLFIDVTEIMHQKQHQYYNGFDRRIYVDYRTSYTVGVCVTPSSALREEGVGESQSVLADSAIRQLRAQSLTLTLVVGIDDEANTIQCYLDHNKLEITSDEEDWVNELNAYFSLQE